MNNIIYEINERPKTVSVERLTKANKWKLYKKIHKPDGFSGDELLDLLSSETVLCRSCKNHIRILNGTNRQIFTSKLVPFYNMFNTNAYNYLFSVKSQKECAHPEDVTISNGEPTPMSFKQFAKWFRITSKKENGFARCVTPKPSPDDGFLRWVKLYTNYGNVYSVAVYESTVSFPMFQKL